jgi:predicted SAM-dependent methyltransferase
MRLPDFSKSRLSIARPISSYSKVRVAYAAMIRNARWQLRSERVKTLRYLNVGCGPKLNDRFIGLDWEWVPGLDLCWDATKGLPFTDGSQAGIFSEHMLEHLSLEQGLGVMREMRRVLVQHGGRARIVVPDLELYVRLYIRARTEDVAFPYTGNVRSPAWHLNWPFYEHGHRFLYDADMLCSCLLQAGFSKAERVAFGTGTPELLIDSPERAVESLYVEAVA